MNWLPLVGVVGAVALLAVTWLWGQKKDPSKQDKQYAEASRRVFQAVHCPKSDPTAAAAFAGCWKVGSLWAPPGELNLKLGMRMSESRSQLLINSHSATQSADSNHPRYCRWAGVPTVAPYPESDFSKTFTYAYVMIDIPRDKAEQIARLYHPALRDKMSFEDYKRIFLEFVGKKGTYIRTLIVQGSDHVWHDADLEEDFWALPVSCEGWEAVEKELTAKHKVGE